jgi:hypothetical protein
LKLVRLFAASFFKIAVLLFALRLPSVAVAARQNEQFFQKALRCHPG